MGKRTNVVGGRACSMQAFAHTDVDAAVIFTLVDNKLRRLLRVSSTLAIDIPSVLLHRLLISSFLLHRLPISSCLLERVSISFVLLHRLPISSCFAILCSSAWPYQKRCYVSTFFAKRMLWEQTPLEKENEASTRAKQNNSDNCARTTAQIGHRTSKKQCERECHVNTQSQGQRGNRSRRMQSCWQ